VRTGKLLGKITSAEFGQLRDRPFLFGIQLGFSFDGAGIGDGCKYMVNISDSCRWTREEKLDAIEKSINHLNQILDDAKVNYVSRLKGKPVEVEIVDGTFKDFRILTEVI